MVNIPQFLAAELSLKPIAVKNALELLAEGATVPFIARYRKERTEEMTETQLRQLFDRFAYLTELQDRKQVIVNAIAEQGKLTDNLKDKIAACLQKTSLKIFISPINPKNERELQLPEKKV